MLRRSAPAFLLAWINVCLVALPQRAIAAENEKARPRAPLRAATDRPNFVMLFVDDLGYGDTGFNGHPTAQTPNIDRLAFGGKVLTTWYSGCPVCSGSRAALMTGRQFARTGVPGVLDATWNIGLPLNETTLAEQLKKADYATAIMGKWHLGQREVYLPGKRGFDYYLGIPYSVDMGEARATSCNGTQTVPAEHSKCVEQQQQGTAKNSGDGGNDPGGDILPLVYQEKGKPTQVLEQPLDLTTLADKYNNFAVDFVKQNRDNPFFLYMPFSHVHTTAGNQPAKQYAGCAWRNTTGRGPFGDALAEADWIVGNVARTLEEQGLLENTLILFTGDNGPWMQQQLSGGSPGVHYGRFSGYWNVGKGSTWEGGIREAAFAHWKGQIDPFSRSAQVVSSMDVFPTLSALAKVPLPQDRVFDGRDMSQVLLARDGRSAHEFLFIYGADCKAGLCSGGGGNCAKDGGPAAVRYGRWKAHWCTGPGLGGCDGCEIKNYSEAQGGPLLFDIEQDPSEGIPLNADGQPPTDPEAAEALRRIRQAYAVEKATFVYGHIVPAPDQEGEGPGRYGICCDRTLGCKCTGEPSSKCSSSSGILGIGSRAHHDAYHDISGEHPPLPPTLAQIRI